MTPPTSAPAATERAERYHVPDMDCASCVQKIRGQLMKVDGVLEVEGSPVQRTLTVRLDSARADQDAVRDAVGRIGYVARPLAGARAPAGASTWGGAQARIAYASAGLFALALVLRAAGLDPRLLPAARLLLSDALLLGSALVGGWNFFPKGWKAARALSLDMNFLMTVAIVGAVAIGELVEGAAIAFLFAIAELLERYSVDRARASIESLMELAPDSAVVLRDGHEVTVPAEDVVAHDLLLVRPGERIATDGVVVEGDSAVDQAAITGESMPVDKVPGDEVFSGTINRGGFLTLRASRPAAESALARIVRLVEDAEAQKSPTERFVERFARYYTPAVTAAAVAIMVLPPLLAAAPFETWFVRGLTLLVIACPCALVISTPVAVVSGVTAAARNGVLIKGGAYLEAMGDVRVVAFDKTGTLTYGHPRVVEVVPADGADPNEVLGRAAALEAGSEHPIARAIVRAATDAGLAPDRWRLTDFAARTGHGAVGHLDGVPHAIGRPAFVAPDHAARAAELSAEGRTVVGLAAEGRPLGWVVLADEPRDGAGRAIRALAEVGVRRTVVLTGDNAATAHAIARRVGADEVRAELLPEDKVRAVKALEAEHGAVAVVGDGVNDAPALAAATVGIAMGAAGSDTALEVADVALMGDDLSRLPYLSELSRRARSIIRQNIAASILVKAALAVGVPLGMVSLVTAVVVGDMGVSLAVTLNGLRLAGVRPRAS